MKKNILFTLMFAWFAVISSAQIVNIPDSTFKWVLVSQTANLNTNNDSEIQVSEALAFTGKIEIVYTNASSLLGIEAFTSVDSIVCISNALLTSIDFSQNNSLSYLSCRSNASLTSIILNSSLNYLYCANNDLSALDISQCPLITHLECYLNNINTLDLSQNTALAYLNCSNNNLNTLDVSQNTALTDLSCSTNNLSGLNVSQNTALTVLNCNNNALDTLIFTPNSTLTSLSCNTNNLTTIDVSQNAALTNLNCYSNNLNALDVSSNLALTNLSAANNNLSSLNVSQNSALTNLSLNNNNLSSLDISQNLALTNLYCKQNNLTDLDVSQQSGLIHIDCSYNDLTFLDLNNGNNTLVSYFRVANNPNLFCISVDDPVWSAANWIYNIDPQTSFSSDCDLCFHSITIDSVLNASCADSGYVWISIPGGDPSINYLWQPLTYATVVNDTQLQIGTRGLYSLIATDTTGCISSKGVLVSGPSSVDSFDLTVNGFQQEPFRTGLNSQLALSASNQGCLPISGQLSVTYSGPLSYINSTTIAPDSISGNTLVWDFTNWTYDSPQFINGLNFMVDSNANIGDQVCFDLLITPLIGDSDTTNNIRHYCYDIVNSYDPNDKQVYPQGKCDPNYVLAEDKLTYTVRFQNTGNAEAIDIYILDSLDADLDLNSVRVVSQSHEPLITEVLDNNVLKFRFDNILLPDSFSNKPESHGFVIYEITPLTGLANGTEIENSAAIYFDLNAPIITNTVLNTIIDVIPVYESQVYDTILDTASYTLPDGNVVTSAGVYTSLLSSQDNCDSSVVVNLAVKSSSVGIRDRFNTPLDVNLYPNPASSSFTLKLEGSPKATLLEVQNILGQIVYTTDIENKETAISTSDWTDGVYHVIVKNNDGKLLASKKLVLLK